MITKENFNCKHCAEMEIKYTLLEDTMHLDILTITSSVMVNINNFVNNIINLVSKFFLKKLLLIKLNIIHKFFLNILSFLSPFII